MRNCSSISWWEQVIIQWDDDDDEDNDDVCFVLDQQT
jgi:hypothetical protein